MAANTFKLINNNDCSNLRMNGPSHRYQRSHVEELLNCVQYDYGDHF